MVWHIFDIGSGKYKFDRKTLNSFIEESRNRQPRSEPAGIPDGADRADPWNDREMQCIFEEVMSLYQDYQVCQSVELLLKLKVRLEEFSLRYGSHVLAAEVLNINSCLPYEHRIPGAGLKPRELTTESDYP